MERFSVPDYTQQVGIHTVTRMFSFIERIVECLRPVNAGLASIVSEGLNSLNDITMNANRARMLSQQLNN